MKKFKNIYLEITNCCNLACGFCQRSARPQAFAEPSGFARTLKEIRQFTDHVALHVLGEPLLHPRLDLLLAACRSQGLKVNLTTNGTLLPRWQEVLLTEPSLRQLNISLHGPAEQLSPARFDSYLEMIFDFIDRAGEISPMIINLRLWNCDPSGAKHQHLTNVHVLERIKAVLAPSLTLSDSLPLDRGVTLRPRLFLSRAERFDWPHGQPLELSSRGTCRGLKDHVAILTDGTVVPCCLDAEGDIPLGNINTATLDEIINNGRASLIRQAFGRQQVIEPLCRRCTYRLRFDRSRRSGGAGGADRAA